MTRPGLFPLIPAATGTEVSGWLQTTVTGPGIFRIYVKTTRTPDITATLSLHGGNVSLLNVTNTDSNSTNPLRWSPLTISVPAGTHHVRLNGSFRYRPGSYYYTQPILEADSARFYPAAPATGQAFDAPELTWLTAGDPGFLVVREGTHDGTDALHAPAQGRPVRLETHLTGPATVSWWRRGTANQTITGNLITTTPADDWIHESFLLGEGK